MLFSGTQNTNGFPILLVEDDSATVDIMQRVSKKSFPEANYIHMTSFNEAVEYFFNVEGTWPKLIILDIYLVGEETGLQFLEFIKLQPAGIMIPVIVLSNTDQSQDIDDAYLLGATSFISKPNELHGWKALLSTIRSYWRNAILPNKPFDFDELPLN